MHRRNQGAGQQRRCDDRSTPRARIASWGRGGRRSLLGAEALAALTVARCGPANAAADPLHTFLGVLALHTTDAETWQRETALLSKLLAARLTDGADAGSWPATPGLDVTTTTLLLATAIAFAKRDPFAAPAPGGATIGAAAPGTWILP